MSLLEYLSMTINKLWLYGPANWNTIIEFLAIWLEPCYELVTQLRAHDLALTTMVYEFVSEVRKRFLCESCEVMAEKIQFASQLTTTCKKKKNKTNKKTQN